MNPPQVVEQYSCWFCWDTGIKLIRFGGFVITGNLVLQNSSFRQKERQPNTGHRGFQIVQIFLFERPIFIFKKD